MIATHGEDGTRLLHRRVEGGTALSSNLGSRALLATARLLDGCVSLRFAPGETRLRLEVVAPRVHEEAASAAGVAPAVWFLDDDALIRQVYCYSWLKPPLDAAVCRVLPPLGLAPEATDAVIADFTREVLDASPRPPVLVLDQNLQSAVDG